MQRKIIKAWPSSRKRESIESAKPSTPIDKDIQSSEWYRSIVQLPLNRFIDAAVDSNLSALIVRGFPARHDLYEAWQNIISEYSDALGDAENKLYLSLSKEVAILSITLKQIEMLIKVLSDVYYPPFVDELNKMLRIKYQFDPSDPEDYGKKLKSCFNRSRSIKIEIDLKSSRLQAMEEKHASKKSPYTRQYFQSVLITISDYAKYQIPDTITVYEYCERLRRFNDYCEQMKKMHNG